MMWTAARIGFLLLLAMAASAEEPPEAWTIGRLERLAKKAVGQLEKGRAGEAQPLVYEAIVGAVALDLPGDHPIVAAIADAFLRLQGRPEYLASGSRYRALVLSRLVPSGTSDVTLFLLRHIWALNEGRLLNGERWAAESAYELAELLVGRDRIAEAKSVIEDALRNSSIGSEQPGWGLRLLDAEIRRREGDVAEARTRIAALGTEIARAPHSPMDFRVPYWLHRSAKALARIDGRSCDDATLRRILDALLGAERKMAEALLASASEARFRSVLIELETEEELFEPIVRCGSRDAAALRTTIERILLRRQMWRYRYAILRVAREAAVGGPIRPPPSPPEESDRSLIPKPVRHPDRPRHDEETRVVDPSMDDPPGGMPREPRPRVTSPPIPSRTEADVRAEIAAGVDALVRLRRLRAQIQLRVPDDALRSEIPTVDIPTTLSPPEGESPDFGALVQIQGAIDGIERHLAQECGFLGTQLLRLEELWPRLLGVIGADGALVGYLPVRLAAGKRRVVAVVVEGRGEVTWTDLGEEESIVRRLEGTWIRIVAIRSDLSKALLRRAGEDLFDPIAARLVNKRAIRLLGSSLVRFVPWTTFVDEQGRFLGDRFAVSWLQSVDDAEEEGRPPDAATTAVVVAPAYETTDPRRHVLQPSQRVVQGGFRTLPDVAKELTAVRSVLSAKGIATRGVTGSSATEAALRDGMGSPAILHIAAHGFNVPSVENLFGSDLVVTRDPDLFWPNRIDGLLEPSFLRTGLALAGANRSGTLREDDGLLTAIEAADLDLRGTALVVLSGCGTATAQLQDVGGTYDLALAFRIAGADAVIGSLWPADDRATMHLMTELYRRLAVGEPVVTAFWQAKRALRETPEFASPFYWAGFEIFGNGDVPLIGARRRPKKR